MTNKKVAYLYLLITFCVWGSLYVVGKLVLGKVPVITVLFLRYLIAGITLFFVLGKSKTKKIEHQDYKYIFLIGFVGYFLSIGLQFMGIKLSSASVASLVNSMNPITITVFAAIILKEKFTIRKIVCVILAIIGVYIIIGGISGNRQVLGIIFSILSVISWSFVSVIVRRITQKYSAIQITAYCMFVAAVCTLPFSGYELITEHSAQFDSNIILLLLYMGVVCTALANVLWNKSLSMIEAGTCSLFYPIQPMVSVLFGCMFLGENIDIRFVLGAILIIGGVLVGILEKRCQTSVSVS